MRHAPLTLLALLLLAIPVAAVAQESLPTPDWPPVATFSILGYDPETGEVGGAVQSRVFSVGTGPCGPEPVWGWWPPRPSWNL